MIFFFVWELICGQLVCPSLRSSRRKHILNYLRRRKEPERPTNRRRDKKNRKRETYKTDVKTTKKKDKQKKTQKRKTNKTKKNKKRQKSCWKLLKIFAVFFRYTFYLYFCLTLIRQFTSMTKIVSQHLNDFLSAIFLFHLKLSHFQL